MDAVAHQVGDVGIPLQKPQQLVDHPFQEDPFGGQQREARLQVEAHLVAEDPLGAGSGAVAAHDPFREDPLQQIEVLFHDSSIFRVSCPPSSSTA